MLKAFLEPVQPYKNYECIDKDRIGYHGGEVYYNLAQIVSARHEKMLMELCNLLLGIELVDIDTKVP